MYEDFITKFEYLFLQLIQMNYLIFATILCIILSIAEIYSKEPRYIPARDFSFSKSSWITKLFIVVIVFCLIILILTLTIKKTYDIIMTKPTNNENK